MSPSSNNNNTNNRAVTSPIRITSSPRAKDPILQQIKEICSAAAAATATSKNTEDVSASASGPDSNEARTGVVVSSADALAQSFDDLLLEGEWLNLTPAFLSLPPSLDDEKLKAVFKVSLCACYSRPVLH